MQDKGAIAEPTTEWAGEEKEPKKKWYVLVAGPLLSDLEKPVALELFGETGIV